MHPTKLWKLGENRERLAFKLRCTQFPPSSLLWKSYSSRLRSQMAHLTPDAWGGRPILGQIKQWQNIADPISQSSMLQRAFPAKVAEARRLLHPPMPSSCCKEDQSGGTGEECGAPSPLAPCVKEQFWAQLPSGSTYSWGRRTIISEIRQPVDRGPRNIPGSVLRKICSSQWWHQFPHCSPSLHPVHTPQLLLCSTNFLSRTGPQQASGSALLLPTSPTSYGSDCGEIHARGHCCEQ